MVEGDEKNLLIRVENNGVMTEEDREKIRLLLSDEKPGENQQPDRMRIGIRNVNLRLKLLYGDESGLSIEEREGTTVSTIRIRKLPERNKESQAQTSTDKNDRQNGQ